MNTTRFLSQLRPWLLCAGLVAGAHAAVTDIAPAPLVTSSPSVVLPNLLFILDDSGSMGWDYMPDWVNGTHCRDGGATSASSGTFGRGCSGEPPFRSPSFNGVYYNPAITYRPAVKSDGVSWPSQTSANTGGWTNVKNDAYGVQSTGSTNLLTKTPDTEYCTDTSYTDCLRNGNYVLPGTVGGKNYSRRRTTFASGTGSIAVGAPDAPSTEARSFGPHYYTIVAGEYCDGPNLRNCQATFSATFSHAATLRWCNNDTNARAATPAANSCQALRTDTYSNARYPTKYFAAAASGQPANFPGKFVRTEIIASITSYPKAASRTDCTGTDCTYDEEMTNFANWWTYYRTRMQTMKTAASLAFAPVSDRFRIGYLSINNNTSKDFLNLAAFDESAKLAWFSKLTSAKPSNSTPLRTALSRAGRLYAGKLNGTTLNGSTAVDPVQFSCQRNYTLLSTDGYWNENNNPTQIDGSTSIGDQDSSLPRPMRDGNAQMNTLSDVAAYYYGTDLRDGALGNCSGAGGADVCENNVSTSGIDVARHQHMTTYTLGMGLSGYMQFTPKYAEATSGDYFDVKNGTVANASKGICPWQTSGDCTWPKAESDKQTTIDDLWHAAVNGRGTYFSASDPAGLYNDLSTALAAIESEQGAAAAATTSNPNVSAGDNFIFASSYTSGEWTGQLVSQQLDLSTGAVSATTDWQAQAKLDANTARTIHTYDPSSTTTRLKPFTWASLSAGEQAWFGLAHITAAGRGLAQFCISGPNCLSAGDQSAAAGEKLVDFVRGDRSQEGSLLDTSKYFRQRVHVLGDIVNSEVAYVKRPMKKFVDPGYTAHQTAMASRRGMVYVGANDGMLHAFDATTGEERWAYVPSMVLPNLYRLADKDYGIRHQHYVDGTPNYAEIRIGSEWRTLLVGGLGAGGRGYYALDITDPDSPKALWEFAHDDLGLTFGKPAITKLKDGTWVVLVASGYNNVAPGDGQGYLYVLDAATGTLIRRIGTGAGSTATPSGLAHIAVWADRPEIDDTTLRVYGGDLLGNVWRFDVNGDIGATGYDAQLLATLRGSTGNVQAVTARPELGSVGGQAVVFVGTGRYLGLSDLPDKSPQTIYAIKDALGASGFGNPRSDVKFIQQTLTDATCPAGSSICTAGQTVRMSSSNSVNFGTDHGWYVDLPATGERATSDPQLHLGTLAFTTNVVDPSACTAGGYSYLNFFDYRTGTAVATATGVASVLLGNALATRPVLARLPNGRVIGLTRMSDGRTIQSPVPINPGIGATRRVSWRELTIEQ